MRHIKLKMMFAWLAILSIGFIGNVYSQYTAAVPSLVTQQTRLSSGGVSPGYVQLRAKPGVVSIADAYYWDQAPLRAAGTFYTFYLDDQNNIMRSMSFGATVGGAGTGAPGYLLQVNATGNGTDWIKPTSIVGANNGLVLDLTSTPGTAIVQLGDSVTGTTGQGALSSNRFVHMNSHDLNFEGSGNMNLGTSAASVYNLTIDPGTAGVMKIHDLIASPLASKFLVLGGGDSVLTRDLSTLVVADNGLSINPVGGFVELGAAATGGAKLLVPRFVTMNGQDLNFDGSGNYNIGTDAGSLDLTINPGTTAGHFITMDNVLPLPNANIDSNNRFVVLDETTNHTYTRKLNSLVNANNGLVVDNTVNPGTSTVQLGGSATGLAPLLVNRFVTLGGKTLNFDGTGNFNIGDGVSAQNIAVDPGAAGTLEIHHLLATTSDTKLLVLGGSDSVLTRDLSTLVVADNGISINPVGGFVELGGAVTNTSPLLVNRFVSMGGKDLNFDGSGNFNVGTDAGSLDVTINPGTTAGHFITMDNVLPLPNASIDSNNRFVVLDEATNHTYTRKLTSLVNANEGLVVDNTLTPGTSTVQLGSTTDGNNPIDVARFVTMTGATPSLTYDGTGTLNLGTAGNLAVNVNTMASNMTIQSTGLDNASANNFAWIDSNTHVVHRVTTAAMGRDNSAIDYIAIDHTTGNIVRSISPTNGIYRGHVAWTAYQQTITLGAGQTIQANASITVTVENHASAGTVAIQVTNVTTGGNTFDIETADSPSAGGFINYVVMNP